MNASIFVILPQALSRLRPTNPLDGLEGGLKKGVCNDLNPKHIKP
jgi:hypothetical protein